MQKQYDLVVIGTGSAAGTAAARCRAAGWTVAVIDSRPFGGTCALRGCHPKKMLVSAADWPELMRFKRSDTDPVPQLSAQGFAEAGIDAYHGRARFVGRTTVAVGEDTLAGRYVLIAAGAKPAPLPFSGAEYLTTSEQFLELEALPGRLVFVGGGYVSFELAHVAARAGAQVTIVHRAARPLKAFDPDLVELLVRRTRALGIQVEVNTEVCGIEPTGGEFMVYTQMGDTARQYPAEMVVHGAGRVPEIDDLDLDAAEVARERQGVIVNAYLQSVSNPAVYAAGDAAASGPPLTPTAAHDSAVVAANLLEGPHQQPNYTGLASVVFTVPPLASAGLTEEAACAQSIRCRVHHEDTSQWFSSRRQGETASGFKVLIDEDRDQIVGAHLLGPHADEVINVFAVAIRGKMQVAELKQVLFAYPTTASDIVHML
jgi:glutathione reductase (NADPH)